MKRNFNCFMRQKGLHIRVIVPPPTTEAQQGYQHEFARDKNPLSNNLCFRL